MNDLNTILSITANVLCIIATLSNLIAIRMVLKRQAKQIVEKVL